MELKGWTLGEVFREFVHRLWRQKQGGGFLLQSDSTMDPPRLVLESGDLVFLQFAAGSKLAEVKGAFPDHHVVDLATSEVPTVLMRGKTYLLVLSGTSSYRPFPPAVCLSSTTKVRLQELSRDWTPFLERCRAAAGVVLPQAASAHQSQKKARSSLIGNAEEEEKAALHSPDTFGMQRKLSTAVLQNLGIVVPPVVPEQNDRVWSIALHDTELEWVLLVFRHRRFRLPAYLETSVGEHNHFPEVQLCYYPYPGCCSLPVDVSSFDFLTGSTPSATLVERSRSTRPITTSTSVQGFLQNFSAARRLSVWALPTVKERKKWISTPGCTSA